MTGEPGSSEADNLALLEMALDVVASTGRPSERHARSLATLSRVAQHPGDDPAELAVELGFARIRAAYDRGWQPLDLVHAVQWRGVATAGRWIARAVLAEFAVDHRADLAPQRWLDQLHELRQEHGEAGADPLLAADPATWTAALSALFVLGAVPRMAIIGPPPSAWGTGAHLLSPLKVVTTRSEDKVLARVRSLLAKAESTDFPAEAEAFTAKAQDLMSRHAIDEALVRAASGTATDVEAIRVMIEPPYAKEKALLVHVVAKANRSRAIWSDWASSVTLVGAERDVDHVEMLYTSALLQATRAMNSEGEDDAAARTIGFRKSFLNGYALRLGERLTEAARSAEESYGGSLLPVLAAQDRAVTDAVERLFPRLRSGSGRRSFDARGWDAGTRAADDTVLPSGQVGPVAE